MNKGIVSFITIIHLLSTYLQVFYIFCLDQTNLFFLIQFTNIVESGEEIAVLILPDKIEYKVQEGEQTSEVPNADPPTLGHKQTDREEDKESIAKKIRKLEKGIEQIIHINYNISTKYLHFIN